MANVIPTLTVADSVIETDPENAIEFVLSQQQQKVTLTLKNLDKEAFPIAFKVKTTQPRRYLVKPNQGMIRPGSVEVIQIVLVDKDRTELLRSYEQMGQTVLDHCKDKFLVQSVAIEPDDLVKYDSYESITELWSSNPSPVANHKLHVRHVVAVTNDAISNNKDNTPIMVNSARTIPTNRAAAGSATTLGNNVKEMTMEQLQLEVMTLRRKYDELVNFSVNLTAERDTISNQLELTKRDYNRLRNNPNSNNNSSKAIMASKVSSTKGSTSSSSLSSYILILAFVVFSFTFGIHLQEHYPHIIQQIPFLSTIQSYLSPSSTSTRTVGSDDISGTMEADEL